MTPWKIAACPEEAGVSSKGLLQYLDAIEQSGLEHHSILILKGDTLVCKMNFAPYDDQTPHVLFSLSKSFASAAAGFAVQEGLLNWDTRVLDVFADKAPAQPSEWLQQVTLHHLLCMGSGLDPKSDNVYGDDWVSGVLACDCNAEPGTRFHYNSHGTYLVSAMVQRVCGMNIRDYLMPRLFEPLGIAKPEWDTCPQGVCVGGWGLHLSSDSIARFGLCLLHKGMWQGKQVLPLEWLERATVYQIDNAHREPVPKPDWAQGYGYQFWRTRGNRYRGDGMYGQICMVSPDDDMVVAITAGINDIPGEVELMLKYLFPAAHMEAGTAEEQAQFASRISSLCYPWPKHDGSVLCGVYTCEEIQLDIQADHVDIGLRTEVGSTVCRCGMGEINSFMMPTGVPGAPDVRCMGSASWSDGRLSIVIRTTDGPFTLKAVAEPVEGGLQLTTDGVGFDSKTVLLKKQ